MRESGYTIPIIEDGEFTGCIMMGGRPPRPDEVEVDVSVGLYESELPGAVVERMQRYQLRNSGPKKMKHSRDIQIY